MSQNPATDELIARLLQRQRFLETQVQALGVDLNQLSGAVRPVGQTNPAPLQAMPPANAAAFQPMPAAGPTPGTAAFPPPFPAPAHRPVQAAPAPAQGPASAPDQGHQVAFHPSGTPGSTAPVPRKPPVWERPGFVAKAIAGVGIAVTLLGVAFVLVLAAQAGLYGPVPRTITAALVSAALVGAAFLVRRRDPSNVGAPALMAAGMAAAYLFVVALTVIYQWVPPLVGLAMIWVIGYSATYVARQWSNQALAVAAVLGGLLLSPYVGNSDILVILISMLGLTLVTGLLTWNQHWLGLAIARFAPTAVVLALGGPTAEGPWKPWVMLALGVVLAGIGVVTASVEAPQSPRSGSISTMLMIGAALPILFLTAEFTATVGLVTLAAVGAAYLAGGFLWRGLPTVLSSAMIAVGTMFVVAGLRHQFGWENAGLYLAAIAGVYLVVGAQAKHRTLAVLGLLLAGLMAAVLLPNLSTLATSSAAQRLGQSQLLASLAAVGVAIAAARALAALDPRLRRGGLVLSTIGGVLFGSVFIVGLGATLGRPAAVGFVTGHTLVSVLLMATAGVFLWFGLRAGPDAPLFVRLAVGMSAVAVAKLFLWDLSALSGLFRAIAFLVVGLALLALGTTYAKAYDRARAGRSESSPPFPPPQGAPVPGPGPIQPEPWNPGDQPMPGNQPASAAPAQPPHYGGPWGPPSA